MATSHYIPKPSRRDHLHSFPAGKTGARRYSANQAAVTAALMMGTDVLAVVLAYFLAAAFRLEAVFSWLPPSSGDLQPLPFHAGYLFLFTASLLVVNWRDGLYGPLQTQTFLHEQRRTLQACFAAGLLLCGGMYIMHNTSISRALVAYLILLTTVFLCLLRGYWRYVLYRRYEHGLDTKNVLIVGAGHIAEVMRRQISQREYLGRCFKGFLSSSEDRADQDGEFVVGGTAQLGRLVRQHFIDEVIIAGQCRTSTVIELVETARELDVEVLVIPGFYEELTPDAPIDYLGDFPVVALHRRNAKVIAHLVKRIWDFCIASLLIVLLSPTLLLLALLVKLTSSGPVLYRAHRVGKKGRIFHCLKFRTMVVNADQLKQSLSAQNERSGILFKIKNDPRITPIGRILRKFSLDELPQLFNVLCGDMSLVGPRPPIASEVAQYDVEHFRRLEVLPGLTGLWQVRARHDPSFERYVALDLAYVENWSFWLDLKILIRTAGVVLRGTGT